MAQQKTDTKNMVDYPFMHPQGVIDYVGITNKYMSLAKEVAREHSLDETIQTGAAIVKGNKVIGVGANGSDYHKTHVCERVRLNIPTGQGYDLCEGCHHKNHGEVSAISNAIENHEDPSGASLYLWGHWWCCEPCWEDMIKNGIKQVFLLKNSEVLFNKLAEGNIVGRQFG